MSDDKITALTEAEIRAAFPTASGFGAIVKMMPAVDHEAEITRLRAELEESRAAEEGAHMIIAAERAEVAQLRRRVAELVHLGRTGKICDDPCRVKNAESGCYCAMVADTIVAQFAEIERLTARAEAAEAQVANAGAVMVEACAQATLPDGFEPECCRDIRIALAAKLRALTTDDATAALAQIEREAEARGRVKGMREAAEIADTLYYPDETKRSAGIRDAILARAAEVEKECGRW